ncbi:MAG: hypothetical protein LLF97_01790 [Planctomycetaceae bacterium]|nr:hypothetical protein [Planctomycetaceae bacterium]
MNLFVAPLAISVDQIIQIVVILLVLVVPVVVQWLAKLQKISPPNQRPNPPRPRPTELTQEIDRFLRRAREKSEATTSTSRPAMAPKTPAPAAISKSEPAPVSTPKPVGGQVGRHVDQYLDEPQKFERREASLGQEVAQVDQTIDQHLRHVFDHRISQLAAVPGEAAASPLADESPGQAVETSDAPVIELLQWLSDPDSLRRAIVLNEILHRPEERWA